MKKEFNNGEFDELEKCINLALDRLYIRWFGEEQFMKMKENEAKKAAKKAAKVEAKKVAAAKWESRKEEIKRKVTATRAWAKDHKAQLVTYPILFVVGVVVGYGIVASNQSE